jgi:hypothetical protein
MNMKTPARTVALDKGESAIFAEQTTYVQTKAYEVKHKSLVALEIFAVDFDVPSGTETVEWRVFLPFNLNVGVEYDREKT